MVKSRVEAITSAKVLGVALDAETSRWLADIGDDLHAKLSKTGIIETRVSRTLQVFLEAYLSERSDLKPRTKAKYTTSVKSLIGFFGSIQLKDVTHEKSALYRVSLLQSGLKEATISKMIGVARLFFGIAHRRKLIDVNPFQYVETGSQVNKEREHYVTEEETRLLIAACPDAKARLIIALARYAGLRIPSELVGLRWSEVNWEAGRFIVHSPKTERKGKPKRVVPIFGELRPYLEDAFEVSPEGEDRIFPEIHEKKSMGSWIKKLANRAGVDLWEKPFQNMRASCATDLTDKHPAHVCEAWLGHTGKVADKHYRQVTETHFEKATQESPPYLVEKKQDIDATSLKPSSSQKKSGTQSVTVHAGNSLQINEATNKNAVNCSALQPTADACEVKDSQGGTRTRTPKGQGILNPQRLPFRHSAFVLESTPLTELLLS